MRKILNGENKVIECMPDADIALDYLWALNTLYNLNRQQSPSWWQKLAEKKMMVSDKASRECWGQIYDLQKCLNDKKKPSEEWDGILLGETNNETG